MTGGPQDLAIAAARAADDKSASDVVVIEVAPVLAITDWFVVAGAANDRQVRAVVDAVEARLKEEFGRSPRSVEGLDGRRWVLLDYGDIVVHVFLEEERSVYRIERLYGDARRLDWRPAGAPGKAPGGPDEADAPVVEDGSSPP